MVGRLDREHVVQVCLCDACSEAERNMIILFVPSVGVHGMSHFIREHMGCLAQS